MQSDSGLVPPLQAEYTPGNWVHLTGDLDPTCQPTSQGAIGCIYNTVLAPCHATSPTFTTTDDFNQGEYINLHAVDALVVNEWDDTLSADPPVLPYLWVACSERGTVVRIATAEHYFPPHGRCVQEGDILGEYWASPEVCRGSQGSPVVGPSRTSVDFDGNVWVANRSDIVVDPSASCGRPQGCGHVVKIGSGLSYQWVDRDFPPGNELGVLDTSGGLADLRTWSNLDNVCDGTDLTQNEPGDVALATDELVLLYKPVRAAGARLVAVDRENNGWVGGTAEGLHGLVPWNLG